MRYTNSLQIMHGDITFLLSEEIFDHTFPYVNDVLSFNEFTRYELNDESFETILKNSRIQRFIWEHLQRLNRVIQRVKVVNDTFFEKKITSCQSVTIFLENKLTYQERELDESKVQKVRD